MPRIEEKLFSTRLRICTKLHQFNKQQWCRRSGDHQNKHVS